MNLFNPYTKGLSHQQLIFTQRTSRLIVTVPGGHSQRSVASARAKCLRGYLYFDDNTADWFRAGKDGFGSGIWHQVKMN